MMITLSGIDAALVCIVAGLLVELLLERSKTEALAKELQKLAMDRDETKR